MTASPLHIIIIEDDPDAREALQAILELDGYRVDVAADGDEGLQLVLDRRPDVAVIDIGLPHMDGFELARRIRAQASPVLCLIALTGWGQPEDRQRATEAGFDAHLVKPVDPSDLERLLRTLCQEGDRQPESRNS